VIQYEDTSFLNDWKEISNVGQQNCGIFLNESHPDKIMKCEPGGISKTLKMASDLENILEHQVFPKIYEVYIREGNNKYIVMERFGGDLTDFILHLLPRKILDKLGYPEDVKADIIKIHELKMPATMAPVDERFMFHGFNEASLNFYENPSTIERLTEENKKSFGYSWQSVNGIKKDIQQFGKLVEMFKNSNVTTEQYTEFLRELEGGIEKNNT